MSVITNAIHELTHRFERMTNLDEAAPQQQVPISAPMPQQQAPNPDAVYSQQPPMPSSNNSSSSSGKGIAKMGMSAISSQCVCTLLSLLLLFYFGYAAYISKDECGGKWPQAGIVLAVLASLWILSAICGLSSMSSALMGLSKKR